MNLENIRHDKSRRLYWNSLDGQLISRGELIASLLADGYKKSTSVSRLTTIQKEPLPKAEAATESGEPSLPSIDSGLGWPLYVCPACGIAKTRASFNGDLCKSCGGKSRRAEEAIEEPIEEALEIL